MQKKILILLGLLNAFTISSLLAQGHQPTLSPADSFSFVKITLTNPDGTPHANRLIYLESNKGHQVKAMTDKKGYVKTKVPIDATYQVISGVNKSDTAFRKIEVNAFPYVTYQTKGYTRRFVYYTLHYRNREMEPIANEAVEVISNTTGKVYRDTTNEAGKASVVLPFDQSFRIAVKYHDNASSITPRDLGKEYKVMMSTFTWMGSQEKERRQHLADSLAKIEYEKMKIYFDSVAKIMEARKELVGFDKPIPLGYSSNTELIGQLLQQKAALMQKGLAKDAKFLEQQQQIILAPLYRNRKKWNNKTIVTDVTGSMSPYLEQVLVWHALQFSTTQKSTSNQYLFFNDGDSKCTNQKTIGSTGGLYFCEGNMNDFQTVIRTLEKGARGGNGGDGPENDIEALLAATQKAPSQQDIILVADNHSNMRDIGLLAQLNRPVHVILCGTELPIISEGITSWALAFSDINEQYLDLARATGGSVHTVTEDIENLIDLKEGAIITIQEQEYILQGGKFLMYSKE